MKLSLLFSLVALSIASGACAKKSAAPLPGDSVSDDGAVTLSPPRMTAVGTTTTHSAETIGAIESRLYPAELVMDHQRAIDLTPAQRDAITKEVDTSQAELVRLQWELQAEKEKLVTLLDDTKVNEGAVVRAATELMTRENKIKSAHLALLVRIKNILTASQQKKLHEEREAQRCGTTLVAPAAKTDAGGS